METTMDEKLLKEAIFEVLLEDGELPRSELNRRVNKKYAEKIYAVEQFPTIYSSDIQPTPLSRSPT